MSALFAAINTPFVNDVTLKRIMSTRGKDNIFQGIFTRPEEACTEKYSTDTDAAEIQIIRVKPNNIDAREIGGENNGGYFNEDDAYTSRTEAYPIRILQTIDRNIDIPANMQDMINVDVAEAELSNLIGDVDTNVNAITIAAQFCKWLNCQAAASPTGNKVEIDQNPGDKAYLGYAIDANAKLDEGNFEGQGVQTYPRNKRAFIFSPDFAASLKKQGVIIGGSNFGQIMVRTGALDNETKLEEVLGFIGEVDNTPCYVCAPAVYRVAEKYLGLAPHALDGIKGFAVSAIGTGRALAFNESVKTIPSPKGQGIRIQPKYRFGAECWDEYSLVPIVSYGYSSPIAQGEELVVKGTRSRSFVVSFDKNGASAGTVASLDAKYYGGKIVLPVGTAYTAPAGKTFKGWGRTADATGTAILAAGSEFTVYGETKLYAIFGA